MPIGFWCPSMGVFEAMALGGRLVTSSGKMEMSPDDAQHLWAKELGLPGDQLGDWVGVGKFFGATNLLIEDD